MIQDFPTIVRFFVMVLGNTFGSHKTFVDHLTISPKLIEVTLVNDSDVIIAFVPIVSRAGTDIAAAMSKIPEGKPIILVVLHHTFDPDYIAPDSRLCVNRNNVLALDCLYHEDHGLLRCLRNDDAIRAVKDHLRSDDQRRDGFQWSFTALIKRHRKVVCAAIIVTLIVVIIVIICTRKSSSDSTQHNEA